MNDSNVAKIHRKRIFFFAIFVVFSSVSSFTTSFDVPMRFIYIFEK